MKPFRILALSALLLISILSACSAAAPQEIPRLEPQMSTPEPENTPPPVPPQNSVNEQVPDDNSSSVPRDLAEKARQDLAQRLGVSLDSIKVLHVIGQEFSVEAFYCRASKERIAKEESPQVISGQSILLSASGRRYEYHASDDETVIFCRPLP
jgi:hypothetical protein